MHQYQTKFGTGAPTLNFAMVATDSGTYVVFTKMVVTAKSPKKNHGIARYNKATEMLLEL